MAPSTKKSKSSSKNSKNYGSKYDVSSEKGTSEKWDGPYIALVIFLAVFVGAFHKSHISNLFENNTHFSHLSTLERELSFRTEMGLYYSYFKTMITADTIPDGMHKIMRDNVTEYPSTINTLKRFNLYPEVVLGIAYRFYIGLSNMVGHKTTKCWSINRGEGMSPVQSCEGYGEPSYFYSEAALSLHGVMIAVFFLFGTTLSDSIAGGLITVACYFYNHGECTRVMWTPPLRESFGYPLFIFQMFLVTNVLKNHRTSLKDSVLIACLQLGFMLSWQFAQFALLTQTLAVMGTYVLKFITPDTFKTVLLGQTIGLLSSFVMLFGNEMLLTSLFACGLASAWILVSLDKAFANVPNWILRLICQAVVFITITLTVKYSLGKLFNMEDDKHIGEIFASKFSNFQNFHTMLYTCAKEFDFIEIQTIYKLLKTLLIPSAIVCVTMVALNLLRAEIRRSKDEYTKEAVDGSSMCKPNAHLLYHTFQLIAFTFMAVMIMRLKLFWTPHLCLYASLLASRELFPFGTKQHHYTVLVGIVAVMGFSGFANLQHQWNIKGSYNNPDQEQLIEWINGNTPKNAVFAGAMPTMATVKLCTLRPIVNHPHYEDAGLRARTMLVYTMYSRKPLSEVKANLQKLGVQYYILEHAWCNRRSRPGCGMAEIWDLEDKVNFGIDPPTCYKARQNPSPHFKRIFENRSYQILKLT